MPSLKIVVAWSLSFFACILTAPLAPDIQPKTAEYKTTFESYNATIQGFNPPPSIPGPYNALNWSVFKQGPFDYQAGQCAYVCPESFPSEAAFGNGYTPGPASISAEYKGSEYHHFTLTDFYFGCNALRYFTLEQGEVITSNSPANCTLTVLGYHNAQFDEAGPQLYPDAQVTFEYIPDIGNNIYTSAPAAPMMHIDMPESFAGMKTVTFNSTVDKSAYLSDPTTLVDDVSYIVTDS